MSTITWLHLSDLHFRSSQTYDRNIVLKTLLEDIAQRVRNDSLQPDFIVISGDIAFSSRPEEYNLATKFLDDLLKTTNLPKERLFLVPGNHDVDRNAISPLTAKVASLLNSRDAVHDLLSHKEDRGSMFRRFHHYQEFVNKYFGKECPSFDNTHYFYTQRIPITNLNIVVLGLNSSWLAASDEDRHRLVLGEQQVRAALDVVETADLCIAIMHHPFDWLQDFDRNDVEALLCGKCDFVLHGHLHQTGLSFEQTPDTKTMTIAAGACYESREYPNAYNFVQLDLGSGRGVIHLRMYSDRQGGFWTKDVVNYRNIEDGIYKFELPKYLRSFSVSPEIVPTKNEEVGDSSISPALYDRLYRTLLLCAPVENDRVFRALFSDTRISSWRFEIPHASSPNELVHITVDYLKDRYSSSSENALALLLYVMADRTDVGDACKQQLYQLANELQQQPPLHVYEDPNPFIYGRPVVGKEFLDRESELRTVFNRLRNGESTAIVGEPHIGKTSLLLRIADGDVQRQYLGGNANKYIVTYMDMHDIGNEYTPETFWNEVLEVLLEAPECRSWNERIGRILQNNNKRRALRSLFAFMGQQNQCLVLLLDEFERLLIHPNFQDPTFFGLLRSLVTTTGGLAFVLASRLSVAAMNERGESILKAGSPFFNNIIQLRLNSFDKTTVSMLFDRARSAFSYEEQEAILRFAGYTPFLVQAMAAAMYESQEQDRYNNAAQQFYSRVAFHFEDMWDIWSDEARTTLILLAIAHFAADTLKYSLLHNELDLNALSVELQNLAAVGLAERVNQEAQALSFQENWWRIGIESLAWWLRDALITQAISVSGFERWLETKRYQCILAPEHWNALISVTREEINTKIVVVK